MLAVISFALLLAVGFGAPLDSQSQEPLQAFLVQGGQVPAGAQVVYLQGSAQQYSAPTQGAQVAYILGVPQTQQYQVSTFQPDNEVSTHSIQYSQPQQQLQYSQPQHVQAHYKAPSVQPKVYTKPVPASAFAPAPAHPKPLTKNYQVQEANQEPHWAILRQSRDEDFDGHFQHDFQTENGIFVQEVGSPRQFSPKDQGQAVQGTYSYTAPDGRVITTSYTADERGFIAQGDHLPVAPEEPELPALIAKSLAYIRSLPPQPEYQQ